MKKITFFNRVIALFIILMSVISLFASCVKEPGTNESDLDQSEETSLIDISGYAIVRYENSKVKVTKKTTSLKNAIKDTLGLSLTVQEDWYNPNTPPDPNAKEILIDSTNRKESQDALAKLESKEGDAYIIEITENKIVIAGKSELSTIRGISYFINNYVLSSAKGNEINISHGKSVVQDYSAVKNIWVTDKLDMDVEILSSALKSGTGNTTVLGYTTKLNEVYFPSVIELQYQPNPEDNGTLIAATAIGEDPVKNPLGCILESRDKGQTWQVIARPKETINEKTGWAGQMAHIYELPAQVGNMPAGTLIYSANAVNYDRASHIGVWKSNDCGKTWKEISIVASGGGLGEGVWEPVMFYDNGYLYCFYSDDSNPRYDQRIVYKRSKDGIRWEALVPVCAFKNFEDRPGMPVITKMGNGEYFLIYEYCGSSWQDNLEDCFVYYKTTSDITNWNPSDPGTLLSAKVVGKDYTTASSPCCVWTPAGGECGTLFAQGRRAFLDGKHTDINRMYVSYDYGKTWDTIEAPMPYDWYAGVDLWDSNAIGYRPIMVLGADPSIIHYVNITDIPDTKKSQLQYARLRVYD